MSDENQKLAVVAFGGNALLQPDDRGTHEEQVGRARQAARWLAEIVRHGYRLVIVHGNGPQVGNILIQAEEASTKVPPQTIDVAVAQTEGSIGLLLQQAMRSRLEGLSLPSTVVTVLTEVEVDPADPAFKRPSKPIGPFFTRYRAETLSRDYGWTMKEDAGRGWRKVVASPRPLRVLNLDAIRAILPAVTVLIAAGGGGVPVVRGRDGQWRGVEAVIDKDYASSLLASELGADLYLILTAVPQVALNFGGADQRFLSELPVADAQRYLKEGHFPPGSMGPKIEASVDFVRGTSHPVLITDVDHLREALGGNGGTRIIP